MKPKQAYFIDQGFVHVTGHCLDLPGGTISVECQRTINASDLGCSILAIPHLEYGTRIRPDLCGQGSTIEEAIERCHEKLDGVPISEIQEAA